jgi:hypothetical protein
MAKFQIVSIDEPIGSDAEASLTVARLVARAEYLGLWPDLEGEQVVDRLFLNTLFLKLGAAGLERSDRIRLSHAGDLAEYRRLLEHALEVTEQSPLPASEWAPLQAVLGDELLAALLDISPASLRRYSRNERGTPDDIAARLHFLALVVADLSGSYNDYGIRRWFARPRQALGGKSPAAALEGAFQPSDDSARTVSQLAGDLLGAGAA